MKFDIPTLQLIAYSALTCASVIVASVSLFLLFRQNVGWKPIVLHTSYGYGPHALEEYEITLEFQVWNRRKYPIVLLGQEVAFTNITFLEPVDKIRTEEELATEWGWDGRCFTRFQKTSLEPNAHQDFVLNSACDAQAPDHIWKVSASVKVYYFDPIRNRELIVKSKKARWKIFRSAAGA